MVRCGCCLSPSDSHRDLKKMTMKFVLGVTLLVELALTQPPSAKVEGTSGKRYLRKAVARLWGLLIAAHGKGVGATSPELQKFRA